MPVNPILIFDFDGVIVDGLIEYWNSSREAFLNILRPNDQSNYLAKDVPQSFRYLRPWVKNGWEMVLIAGEIFNPTSYLNSEGIKQFTNNYKNNCDKALKYWGWDSGHLQKSLDEVRQKSIDTDLEKWLSSHKAFPQIVQRLNTLKDESIDFGVLTTKNAFFTVKILDHLNLYPSFIYGYESGSKPEVLREISKKRTIKGFVEDRRATLETVLNIPELHSIPCYLASWGYLKPDDVIDLPSGIKLLETKNLTSPLANWI